MTFCLKLDIFCRMTDSEVNTFYAWRCVHLYFCKGFSMGNYDIIVSSLTENKDYYYYSYPKNITGYKYLVIPCVYGGGIPP